MPKKAPTKDAVATAEPTVTELVTSTPSFERDSRGLLVGINYAYTPEGKVDWRKMIKPEYLDFKKELKDEIEKVYGKKLDEISVNEVDDKYLLIRLSGIKDLLQLRGASGVRYPLVTAMPGFVSVICEIDWIPNFETGGLPWTFTDGADATPDNVEGWYANFLTTAAINRAFVRAVRNFLGIYITGVDEIGSSSKTNETATTLTSGVSGFGPHAMLKDLLQKKNRSFDELIAFLKKKEVPFASEVDSWASVDDIPKDKVFTIVGLIKKT